MLKLHLSPDTKGPVREFTEGSACKKIAVAVITSGLLLSLASAFLQSKPDIVGAIVNFIFSALVATAFFLVRYRVAIDTSSCTIVREYGLGTVLKRTSAKTNVFDAVVYYEVNIVNSNNTSGASSESGRTSGRHSVRPVELRGSNSSFRICSASSLRDGETIAKQVGKILDIPAMDLTDYTRKIG